MKSYIISLALLLYVTPVCGQQTSEEAALKAAFIIDLLGQVEWPSDTVTNQTTVILVIGQSELTAELQKLAQQKTPAGRKIEIRAISIKDDFSRSKIVVIAIQDLTELAAVLKALKGLPVLTVSDRDGFAGFGVMVDFLKKTPDDTGKLSFAINKMVLKEAGLKISESLIKQAKKTYG
jgi:hypothetical protein